MKVISDEIQEMAIELFCLADEEAHTLSQVLGAGSHIENCIYCEKLAELRAAPDTVSLEGVERLGFNVNYAEAPFKRPTVTELVGKTGEYVHFSGLQRLVQPSAVVSREAIYGEFAKEGFGDSGWVSRAVDAIYALQLPQSVAPVQSGDEFYIYRGRQRGKTFAQQAAREALLTERQGGKV